MFNETFHILLVEDNSGDAYLIQDMLAREGRGNLDLEWVTSLADGLERLDRGGIDVVLLDLGLPDSQGLDTFTRASSQHPQMPIVVLTGLADETVGVSAVRQGAQDYLIKGEVDGKTLLRTIRYATERKRVEEALKQALEEWSKANLQLQQEVEERRRAEEAVEAERRRLFSLLETLPAFVYVKAPDYSIRFANRVFRETFGPPEGKHCYQAVFGRSKPCPDCRSFQVLETKHPQEWEWNWEEGNRIFYIFNYPFADIDGSPLILTMGLDIAARKHAEEDLKKSEARYRTLVEQIPVVTYIAALDQYSTTLYTSPQVERVLGFSQADFHADPDTWEKQIHPEDRDRVLAEVARSQATGEPFVSEYRLLSKSGRVVWVRDEAMLVYDPQGKPLFLQGVLSDITERIQAEISVRYLTHELMRAQEQEKHKISMELHDTVAQELVALKIGLENLRDSAPVPEEKISTQAAALLDILQPALNSIRTLSYNLRPPDLEHLGLVQATRNHCEEVAARSGLNIDFNAAGVEAALLEYESAINLYRIIQEGLANVWRHAGAKNVSIRIVASHPKIILRIEDDGHGFEATEKVAPDRRGRRMGLLGMRERVAILGGEMHLESQPNKGTKIFIDIPWSREGHGAKEKDSDS